MKLLRLVVKIQINPKGDSLIMSSHCQTEYLLVSDAPQDIPVFSGPCEAKLSLLACHLWADFQYLKACHAKRRGLTPRSCVTGPRRQILIQLWKNFQIVTAAQRLPRAGSAGGSWTPWDWRSLWQTPRSVGFDGLSLHFQRNSTVCCPHWYLYNCAYCSDCQFITQKGWFRVFLH